MSVDSEVMLSALGILLNSRVLVKCCERLRCCAQFIAGMLGSMGVQGAVQVMHTTVPMEWMPSTGEAIPAHAACM